MNLNHSMFTALSMMRHTYPYPRMYTEFRNNIYSDKAIVGIDFVTDVKEEIHKSVYHDRVILPMNLRRCQPSIFGGTLVVLLYKDK